MLLVLQRGNTLLETRLWVLTPGKVQVLVLSPLPFPDGRHHVLVCRFTLA
ncbi:hypothetical protein SEA_GHOBES_45 [Gordonia phage Ghobes]|uniref:Uncharacterized protein n=1 Tax=Gordonia phage Ghobes TaxID=1887647 RepID=A0A1B3B0A5_9CAUD|nr:hypothetical protein KCH37_gp45 [Gordonia phage Ghobes]AOE44396.1 hypothetical protein SEA_GHOBES_45 [Gordonia phage Ghobes]